MRPPPMPGPVPEQIRPVRRVLILDLSGEHPRIVSAVPGAPESIVARAGIRLGQRSQEDP